jgi:excisionase family DNA binding protein
MTVSTRNPKSAATIGNVENLTEPQHIAVQVIAGYCMVSRSTVHRWLEDGKLKSLKLPSRQYRVSVEEFKDFLRQYNMPIKEEFFTGLSPR